MIINEQLKERQIILASKSPRRHFLMNEAGIDHIVFTDFEVDETYPETLPVREIPLWLAIKKSMALNHLIDERTILITADTAVICEEKIINKPDNIAEARLMLKQLSGRKHTVVTGVTIRSQGKTEKFSSSTVVKFRSLKPEEISWYVDNYSPLDKAGAYGIQEWIGYIGVKSVHGSYFNVMGLPVHKVYTTLLKF